MAGVVGGDGDVDPLTAVVHRVLEALGQRQREYAGAGRAHGHVPRVPGHRGHGGGQGPRPGAGAVQVRHLDGRLRPGVREQSQQRDQRDQEPYRHHPDVNVTR